MIGSIPTPKNSTRLSRDHHDPWSGPRPLVVLGDSTSDPSDIRYPTTHDVPVEGDMSLGKKGYAPSAASMQNEAQTELRPRSKRPSLRRVGRLPARTFPPPGRARKFKIQPPSPAQVPAEHDSTSPRTPPSKRVAVLRNSEPPLAIQPQNRGACRKNGEETQLIVRGTFERDPSDGDEDEGQDEEEESSDDEDEDEESDDEEYEDDSEGRKTTAPHIKPRLLLSHGPTLQSRAIQSEGHQSYIPLPKTNGRPQVLSHRVLQRHQNGSPLARHTFPHPHNTPLPEDLHPRPASLATSHTGPQRILEGPQRTTWPSTSAYLSPAFKPTNRAITYHPGLGGSSGDVAGPSIEWDERSEAGGSKRRSIYSQQSNSSVARSIYLEQQVARREEEAARREEEARRKEEDARGLEMAARKAFAWVQSLEARAGKMHDAVMRAEAKAQRRDAEIWERQAEMLRQQADTAKREVEVTKREIAVQRAEQEARRTAREARRKEAELLLKEGDVQRKEQEALRLEEDARRMKVEMRWREEQLLQREEARRAAEGGIGVKDVVVSAWGKLKGRIGRDSQVDKWNTARILQDKGKFDGNSIGVGSANANTGLEVSTRAIVQIPRHMKVERRRTRSTSVTSTIPVTEVGNMVITGEGLEQEELRSVSHVWTSECGTSAEVSAEYTVKSVNSYKERLHRSPAGYFRHAALK